MDAAWHNCLVGCLRCQWVCPENRDVRQWIEDGVVFTPAETELLLEGVPLEEIPACTLEKMQRVHLDLWAELLPRNLHALFAVRELSLDEVARDHRPYSMVSL